MRWAPYGAEQRPMKARLFFFNEKIFYQSIRVHLVIKLHFVLGVSVVTPPPMQGKQQKQRSTCII